ncbi:hypothetical protein DJ010_09820 [Nocardioides silvaticus]|uniref:Lipoprotein n=1 Tax=Nocardioides silvaticus TaxID=2201891 RepID=A0A316TJH2_9ACTN|nr:hypothetical protein [Nocardioides silvaticus]PWN03389.1 hypothetical protein DJ010_09820 [Nocardioides silvaticus]
MNPLQRAASAVAAVAAVLALGSCGGPPTDASRTEFCATATDQSWAESLGEDTDGDAIADAVRGWGDDLRETGTPEGIPDDAREGFELTVDYLRHVDADDFEDLGAPAPVNDDLSEEEQDKVTAFDEYVAETCRPDLGVDVPGPAD